MATSTRTPTHSLTPNTMTQHTDSVEAVGSLLYEVKHRIEWDYSYYVSREESANGYWKRVSSIEEIPTHAVSTHRTHPVDEPDNLFLFKIYQYLLNHQQQVEEAVNQALRNVPLGFVRQWINEDRTLPNQKLVTEADIQAFINIALTPNHQD